MDERLVGTSSVRQLSATNWTLSYPLKSLDSFAQSRNLLISFFNQIVVPLYFSMSVMMKSRHDRSPLARRSCWWSSSSRITLSCFAISNAVSEQLFILFGLGSLCQIGYYSVSN